VKRPLAWYIRQFEKRERQVSELARRFRAAVKARDAEKARLLEQGRKVRT
jgi:hypothetical protein